MQTIPTSEWSVPSHSAGGSHAGVGVAMVIRSELFRRYPNTVVSAIDLDGNVVERFAPPVSPEEIEEKLQAYL